MTAGQDALREAARLEAARVYGRVVPEFHNGPRTTWVAHAEAELAARADTLAQRLEDCGPPVDNAPEPVDEPDDEITDALRRGLSVSEIASTYCVEITDVRAARKRLMAGAA